MCMSLELHKAPATHKTNSKVSTLALLGLANPSWASMHLPFIHRTHMDPISNWHLILSSSIKSSRERECQERW